MLTTHNYGAAMKAIVYKPPREVEDRGLPLQRRWWNALMDDEWIYGGRLEQIHQTLVEERPNGMPAWGGKIPDDQLWQMAAYVRSMSLPATLAAQNGPTPSQSPAPVPREADADTGWSAASGTTNDYTTTVEGPQ
jgi:hypothetical protein